MPSQINSFTSKSSKSKIDLKDFLKLKVEIEELKLNIREIQINSEN